MTSTLRWQAGSGTAQQQRLPPAMGTGYFRVDERGLPDLVEMTAALARRLPFFDLRNRPAGDWGNWIRNDEAFILARFAGIGVERLAAEFLRDDGSGIERHARRFAALAKRIDDWYAALKLADKPAMTVIGEDRLAGYTALTFVDRTAGMAVCAQIRRLVEEHPLFGELARSMVAATDDDAVQRFRKGLHNILGTDPANPSHAMAADDESREARKVFSSFLNAVAQVKELAAEQLAASLARDSHEPSAALFLAFLQLQAMVQQRINEFTPRHTDFYYRDCLRMAPRTVEPDSVYLVCGRAPAADLEVTVPQGAAFVLRNAGREIVYRADEELEVTPVRLAALHTLRLERDPLISPERELNYVTRAKATRLPVAVDDDSGKPGRPYWPLFGGSPIRAVAGNAHDAELGIAIASPVLLLREGEREVRIRLCLAHPADLDAWAAEECRKFATGTQSASADGPGTLTDLLERLFLRFGQIDRQPGAEAATDDEAELVERARHPAPGVARRPAPRIAASVLVRRLRALTGGNASRLRKDLKAGATVRSAWDLAQELQAEIGDEARTVLGPDIVLNFVTDPATAEGIQFLVNGVDRLPGEALELARLAAPRIAANGGHYDLRRLYSGFLVQRLLGATDEKVRFELLGRLFCRWMLLDAEALSGRDVDMIRRTLEVSSPGSGDEGNAPNSADVLGLISGDQLPERGYLVGKLLSDLFDVSLTGRDGWFFPADAFATSGEPAKPGVGKDLAIVFRLPPEAPPIVAHDGRIHGGGWQTALPALRLRLKPDSALASYSLLAEVVLTDIHIDVAVRGAADAVLYNNLGRLDPSKPFNPFGPLPARGAYLVFGSAEVARKKITSLTLNVEWGNLPADSGGFRYYYRGYESGFSNQGFKVASSILSGGLWEPRANGTTQPLFPASPDDQQVSRAQPLKIDGISLRNHFRPVRGAGAEEEFQYDVATRGGFFRIALAEPAQAFGHAEYPHLLTKVLSGNAKHRRQLPLPNAPYTPLIERLTFDYRASASMNLAQEDPAERSTSDERVFLIHPFGFEEVYPAIGSASKGPIPCFGRDGNLYIGLAAERAPERVTLLFSLRDESARGVAGGAPEPRISWCYLASNRWRALDAARVLADSTHGFLTSGIVTLDIPQDIDRANTILSPEWFWLCVSADTGFERFAGLYGVQTQALRATRERAGAGASADGPPVAGTVAQPLVSIPGLISVVQSGDAFGGRAAESTEQFKTRTGERLRHKNRAASLWDYERLVLERFPDVFMVKCFPAIGARASAMGQAAPAPRPGCVTLAVVPVPQPGVLEEIRAPKLNAVELERIKDYIRERASPFAEIVVRNAAYERIQVRCAVRLKKGVAGGRALQRLNQDIVERISPWRPGGLGARFDWILRKDDVEAWIREFDYVESVARVSLLQISEGDDGYFVLGDSARVTRAGDAMQPLLPWSIAIPARRHMIELMARPVPVAAQATGIAGLEIGNTFIVARGSDG